MKFKLAIMSILSLLAGALGCTAGQSDAAFSSVDVATFKSTINECDVVVLDVRTAAEYAEGHLAHAACIDVSKDDFEAVALASLPRNKTVALYCRSGNRSKKAAAILARNGFKVVELSSGVKGWIAGGGEVTREEVDFFVTPQGSLLKIYCIKHGTLRMNIDGKWLYVDPVGNGAMPFTDFSTMPRADIILVTHEHGDHLDAKAIEALIKDDTQLVVNARSNDLLGGKGQVLANGETTTVGDITIKVVPAYNTSPDKLMFHPRNRDNGYVVSIDGFNIYIAGDTEDIEEMKLLKNVDVALLPCNLPYTMTPEQLAHAARMINPRVLFPYHYGTTDIIRVEDLLKNTDIDVRIRQYQ